MARRKLSSEINVVPYIDVMLVLLIIFMITAPLLTQGVEVSLPETSAQPLSQSDQPLTLSVDARGRYFLSVGDPKKSLGDEDVLRQVEIVMRNNPQEMVLVNADKAVPYQFVAQAMTLLQHAGVAKIGFVTDPNMKTVGAPKP